MSQKDCARLLDALRQAVGIGHLQLQVFRGKAIRQLCRLLEVVAVHDQAPVAD